MAFEHLDNTKQSSVTDSVSHIVQDIRDFFMPHDSSTKLNAQAGGKSDSTVGGILPPFDVSLNANDVPARFDSSGNISYGDQDRSRQVDSGSGGATAFDLNQERDMFIKMEKTYYNESTSQKTNDSKPAEQAKPSQLEYAYDPTGVAPAYLHGHVDSGSGGATAFDLNQEKDLFIKMEKGYYNEKR